MKRRDFLVQTGLASFAAGAVLPAPGGRPDVKITDIKTFLVGVGSRNLLFVKVETDQGIHGIGEAYSCGPDEATVATINDFKRWLVGQDPRNIEHLWAMMFNFTRFPGGLVVNAAISGIEHALWDIQRQGGRPARLPAARRQVPRQDSRLPERPRRRAEGGRRARQGAGAEVRLHGGEDVAAHAATATRGPTTR